MFAIKNIGTYIKFTYSNVNALVTDWSGHSQTWNIIKVEEKIFLKNN